MKKFLNWISDRLARVKERGLPDVLVAALVLCLCLTLRHEKKLGLALVLLLLIAACILYIPVWVDPDKVRQWRKGLGDRWYDLEFRLSLRREARQIRKAYRYFQCGNCGCAFRASREKKDIVCPACKSRVKTHGTGRKVRKNTGKGKWRT
ncbi:MAG: hypothetical protein ACI4P4_00935 [Faecousia sp.]